MIGRRARAHAAFDISFLFPCPPVIVRVVAFNLVAARGDSPEKWAERRIFHLGSLVERFKKTAWFHAEMVAAPDHGVARHHVNPERQCEAFT